MHKFTFYSLFLLLCTIQSSNCLYRQLNNSAYHAADTAWTIIGAGPAGIAVIGILRDLGIPATQIAWIDPHFQVGRLGRCYYNVPGNALAENYISFVNNCSIFKAIVSPALERLRTHFPYSCPTLQLPIDALQDITEYLKTKATWHTAIVSELRFINNNWLIRLNNKKSFTSHNVVLATGSHPKILNYPCKNIIPLDDALDKKKLSRHLEPNDTIALIGGSHSCILVLKHLYELNVKRIINFYRHPITYAYDMGNNNTPDYNGLKGDVAKWAFSVLEQEYPETIMRVKNTDRARSSWLPVCNKIIYAVGFERNKIPIMHVKTEDLVYDDTTGVIPIAPRLFGVGFAFPEKIIDPWGKPQHTVGLIDFLRYVQRVIPSWLNKRTVNRLQRYEQLLTIHLVPYKEQP